MSDPALDAQVEFIMAGIRREEKWHRRFLSVAKLIATWSKDPSSKTGCLIVDKDKNLVSGGYNGFPRGVQDNEERYNDRKVKYSLVAHCDRNAIDSAARRGVPLRGCTMYLTGPPCNECMKSIIQSGISRVVWPEDNPFENDPATRERWKESIEASELMARESGVEFKRVPEA